MANATSIEWTEATWNPVAGCTVTSPGCINCYAMRMARRLELMGQLKYAGITRMSGGRAKWNGIVKLDVDALDIPRRWTVGRTIFVNSMSDLFHKAVPFEFIQAVFNTMTENRQHTFQMLTKRSSRVAALSSKLHWPKNVWMGVSVESQEYVGRIDDLRRTSAGVKFLSLEPLIGPLDKLDLTGIDWVIAGGESGPGARPIHANWMRSIRDQCLENGVAFHFKQWGGPNKKKTGRVLDGRTWDEQPTKWQAEAVRAE